jgi:hypothetical protein
MHDFFSKHGECVRDRDTIHIPNNSQGEKYTTHTKNMLKVLKEMVISLNMHILQEYGRNNSTMSVFPTSQGWGFVVHALLLNQEGVERGMHLQNYLLELDSYQL